MRCKICDAKLTDGELLKRDLFTGLPLDTCSTCMGSIGEAVAEDFEYIDDVNVLSKIPLDKEENDLQNTQEAQGINPLYIH